MAFTLDISSILKLGPWGSGDFSHSVSGDSKDYSGFSWYGDGTKPLESELQSEELAAAKSFRISAVKNESQDRILASVPQWKQNNLARGAYDTPTSDALNSTIDSIRTDSDAAESAVNAFSSVQDVLDFTW